MRVRVRGLGDTSLPEPQNQRVYRGIDSLAFIGSLHPNRASFGGGEATCENNCQFLLFY